MVDTVDLPPRCGQRAGNGEPCAYPAGHPQPWHSWEPIEHPPAAGRYADLQAWLAEVFAGEHDAHLEEILSVAHQRKLTIRGIRVFGSYRGSAR